MKLRMKLILLTAAILLVRPAGAMALLRVRTQVAVRSYEHCMLGQVHHYARGSGSPQAQAGELEAACADKYQRLHRLVRRDLARRFQDRPGVNVDARAQMMAESMRQNLRHRAVALITKIRFGY